MWLSHKILCGMYVLHVQMPASSLRKYCKLLNGALDWICDPPQSQTGLCLVKPQELSW